VRILGRREHGGKRQERVEADGGHGGGRAGGGEVRAGAARGPLTRAAFSDHPFAPGFSLLIFISHGPRLIN
jgi:hypothetical protein